MRGSQLQTVAGPGGEMEGPLPQATHVVMGEPITGEYTLSPQPQAPVTSREIGIPLADLGRRDQGKGAKSWRAEQQGQTPGVRTQQRGLTAKEPSASASYCRVTNSPPFSSYKGQPCVHSRAV